ncbi:hypothetical protein BT69DRAFT_1339357 [Atractiella rhizophila]|nr:hypothetical protein BT69DRAFT_1339357 [Atractiella rhizophila]
MDIYTLSFCLPRSTPSSLPTISPTPSFDLSQSSASTSALPSGVPGIPTATTSASSISGGHGTSNDSPSVASSVIGAGTGTGHSPSHSVSTNTSPPHTAGIKGSHGSPNRHSTASSASTVGTTTTSSNSLLTGTSATTTAAAGAFGVVGGSGVEMAAVANPVGVGEALKALAQEVMASHQCLIQVEKVGGMAGTEKNSHGIAQGGAGWNFNLSGGYNQVMSARGALMREAPFKRKCTVKVPRNEVLDSKDNVRAEMRGKLDDIASLTKSHLAIVGSVASNSAAVGFGFEAERNVEIVITGSYESVEQARVRLLVLLDELSGLHSELCEIDFKLHNIIAGRRRCVIQTIQEETATNIYLPTPFLASAKQNFIFITGEFFNVQRARDMLFQVSLHKSKCIISRDTALLPRKLDWILTDRLEDIKQAMNDNGTFVHFPVLGSQTSVISVFGDHRTSIERTIRFIMQLACQYYVASFWLLPISFDMFMPSPTINPSQVPALLKRIAMSTGAEVVFKTNCFELHGMDHEVRAAVQMILEFDLIKNFHHEIKFQLELANDQREFISGKKNGKINKIMKTSDVKVKFETFNDYNFLIDVAGNDASVLQGLTMLQEELPAEISFHVPETYHKRIIGVGGKNIQRIMKKYGVYVKFSNAEEFANLGGYTNNEDNVVARTPAKNAVNLENLKIAVMEMVGPKDKDFVVETLSIPRRYHRVLVGEKNIFLRDIETRTNSLIRFPNKESASDIVTIFGPETQVHIAAQMLLVWVPFEAELRLPHSAELSSLAFSSDFVALTDRIKKDLNITVLPSVDRSGGGDETVLRFHLNRSNTDLLPTAREIIEEFLLSLNINLYPGSRPRSDSFADSFPYFNSKLLSSTVPAETPEAFKVPDAKLRGLGKASSTPDIKAIFNAPSYAKNKYAKDTMEYPMTCNPSITTHTQSPTYGGYWDPYSSWSPRSAGLTPQQPYSPIFSASQNSSPVQSRASMSALRKPRSYSAAQTMINQGTGRGYHQHHASETSVSMSIPRLPSVEEVGQSLSAMSIQSSQSQQTAQPDHE